MIEATMGLDDLLGDWEKKLDISLGFRKDIAYMSAFNSLGVQTYTQFDLDGFMQNVAGRWSRDSKAFRKYGLFISALVNRMLDDSPEIPLIVRVGTVRDNWNSPGMWTKYGKQMVFDYLGYKQSVGFVVYDGDSGYAFGEKVAGTANLVLTGNSEARVGWKQRGGNILVFGNVGDKANERQTGGMLYVHGNAKNFINVDKKQGETYVNGNAGRYAGKNMSGGLLIIKHKAGANCAQDATGNAKVYVMAGVRGEQSLSVKHVHFEPFISDTAITLHQNTCVKLKELGVEPYYHRK